MIPDVVGARLALARATKNLGTRHPITMAARRDYDAAMATAQLAERLTYGGLPFTDSQLDTLENLVRNARAGDWDTNHANGSQA